MSADLQDLTVEELRAENLRLRRLLDEARRLAEQQAFASADARTEQASRLAESRRQAASHRDRIATMRKEAPVERAERTEDTRGEPTAAADLVAELRISRARARASEERLALAFDASGSIGWWDWDVPANKLYASPYFARMYGVDPELAAEGAPLSAFVEGIHPDDREWVGQSIAGALETGGEFAEEYRLAHRDGEVSWIYARGRCYLDEAGRPVRYPGVAMDITQRKLGDLRKASLVELGDRLREAESIERIAYTAAEVMARTLGATRAGIATVDLASETATIQPDWQAPGVESIAGLHRFRDYGSFIDDLKRGEAVVIGDVTADPRTAANAEALLAIGIRVLVNLPILEHGQLVAVAFVHHQRAHDWLANELNFVRAVGDRTQAAIGRIRAEEQQRLLNRELGHRLKNNLAMVQAIAAHTLRNAPDLETARSSLSSRLATLGRAHELLLSGSMESTDMAAVAQAALAIHDDGQGRIRFAGPPLDIGSSVSLSLALVLHELATNAAKYGALSVPEGHVELKWEIDRAESEPRLRLSWTERGGPPVAVPARRGFGSRLIERGLAGAIGGEVSLDYRREGLVCRIAAPLAGLQPDG